MCTTWNSRAAWQSAQGVLQGAEAEASSSLLHYTADWLAAVQKSSQGPSLGPLERVLEALRLESKNETYTTSHADARERASLVRRYDIHPARSNVQMNCLHLTACHAERLSMTSASPSPHLCPRSNLTQRNAHVLSRRLRQRSTAATATTTSRVAPTT
eukprot:365157-Chlamydomonas_euryale.AAC.31